MLLSLTKAREVFLKKLNTIKEKGEKEDEKENNLHHIGIIFHCIALYYEHLFKRRPGSSSS